MVETKTLWFLNMHLGTWTGEGGEVLEGELDDSI